MEEAKEVKKSARPAKGSEEAKIWGAKMAEAKRIKREAKQEEKPEQIEKKPRVKKVLKE